MRKLEILEPLVSDIDDPPEEDVVRLLAILSARGYEASSYQATRLWHIYSDSMEANWLWLPSSDDTVWDCIERYIAKHDDEGA